LASNDEVQDIVHVEEEKTSADEMNDDESFSNDECKSEDDTILNDKSVSEDEEDESKEMMC